MSCFGLLITYSLFLLHPLLCGLNFDAHNSKSTNSTKPHICISLLALSLLDIYNKNLIKISSQHNFTRRRRREVNNTCSMAQATMVMCGFSGQATSLKKQPLLLSQIHRIKPNYSISHLFFSPLPPRSSSFSSSFTAFALFKPKTKAPPPKKVVAKPKKQVEDGIFGTSGGIGFTKQNELFVGRVAMLGFAASLLGEAITGKGILSQLNIETGIPIYEAEPLLLFFILFTLLGAIGALGDRGQFIDDPPTGLEKAVIPPGKGIKSALGLKEGGPLFGFTKSNELFVGRLAQLGFVFSLIGEIITGKGALAQLNIETGVPINEIEPLVLFNVAFFFFAALNPGTGKFITDEEED